MQSRSSRHLLGRSRARSTATCGPTLFEPPRDEAIHLTSKKRASVALCVVQLVNAVFRLAVILNENDLMRSMRHAAEQNLEFSHAANSGSRN